MTKDTQSQLFWPPEGARPTGEVCMRAAKPCPAHHLRARCPVEWCLSQSLLYPTGRKAMGKSSFPKPPSPTQLPQPWLSHHRSLVSNFRAAFRRLPQEVSSCPLGESLREKVSQETSQQQHTRPESLPHFPFCGPRFHSKGFPAPSESWRDENFNL